MQTINNRMTETQIADLFSLAVKLQVKAEESDDRDTAILAYSIQNACSNLTESQREFRAADATIHNLELKLTDMAVQLANAESKCRELAAENGELKSYRPRPGGQVMMEALDAFEAQDDYPEGGMMDAFELLCCKHVETPATDAFLAEVRAQGVEMFAERKNNEMMSLHPDTHAVGSIAAEMSSQVKQLREFAAQLRKGAAL